MNAPLMTAAAMQMARDELWRNPPPLAADCVHDLELLPVIEPRFTVLCRKCGGLDVTASRAIGSASPDAAGYVILADNSVRPLSVREPPAVSPPLTHDQVRHLLRECVTVVKPGETLIVRVPLTWVPEQVDRYARDIGEVSEAMDLPFKTVVVAAEELAIAEPGGAPGAA